MPDPEPETGSGSIYLDEQNEPKPTERPIAAFWFFLVFLAVAVGVTFYSGRIAPSPTVPPTYPGATPTATHAGVGFTVRMWRTSDAFVAVGDHHAGQLGLPLRPSAYRIKASLFRFFRPAYHRPGAGVERRQFSESRADLQVHRQRDERDFPACRASVAALAPDFFRSAGRRH